MQIYKSIFKNRSFATLMLAGVLAASIATPSHAKTKPDCCASGEDVYRPSAHRIKITQSPALNKQLAAVKGKPAELAKMRKAISVGNKLIQGHVNGNLYRYGWDPVPYGSQAESLAYEEGWQTHFGDLVALPLKEFRAFLSKPNTAKSNESETLKKFNRLVCPFTQLADLVARDDKIYLTYRFVHVARPSTVNSYDLDKSTLDVSDNGKTTTLLVVVDREFKFLPLESITRDWWSTTDATIQIYKRDLRGREQGDFSSEKNKPNLRNLLVQITEAEKVCNKPNPFQ